MTQKHSSISPSQAYRFFNCPGSVVAQSEITEQEPSSAAQLEGIAIHELAAMCLRENCNPYDYVGDTLDVTDNFGDVISVEITDEFAFAVTLYCNTIDNILKRHSLTRSALQIEVKYTIPEIDDHARGITDCCFIAENTLYVIDLKGGRGVIVDPEENLQCMYYALRPYYDAQMFVQKIVLGIIQPRAKEGEYVKMWETTPTRLLRFSEELKIAIAKTRVENPEYQTGDWCRWCKAQSVCGVQRETAMAHVQSLFPEVVNVVPQKLKLTPENVGKALQGFEAVKQILDQLYGYATAFATKGMDVPGYSLVRGKKMRQWIDEESVISAFEHEVGEKLFTKKLCSPVQLEKVVGKDKVSEFVTTPEGDLKLVPTKEAKEYISQKVEEVFKNVELD